MKQYIGIVRDHSGSMGPLAEKAREDYNSQIEVFKQASREAGIDTIVSVVECGVYPEDMRSRLRGSHKEFRRAVVNSGLDQLKHLQFYPTPGDSTPLFDSVKDLISILESVPDAKDKDVAFLLLVITDGYENVNPSLGYTLGKEIQALQGTDRWTFTFRVPRGNARGLSQLLGIPIGNFLEWEQTEHGFVRATTQTTNSTQFYYRERAAGKTFSTSFYSNPVDIKTSVLKKKAEDITNEVKVLKTGELKKSSLIENFVVDKVGKFQKGAAFYQLTKTESSVQSYKQLVLRDRETERFYGGEGVRDLLGLPTGPGGSVRLTPGKHGKYDVFVQSTSVNRKLVPHTDLVIWEKVRA